MAKTKATEYEDTLRDIYDVVQEAGTTRAEMESSLDQIATLCAEAVPDLDEGEGEDADDGDADGDGDSD